MRSLCCCANHKLVIILTSLLLSLYLYCQYRAKSGALFFFWCCRILARWWEQLILCHLQSFLLPCTEEDLSLLKR
jgi:hypothetical protein